MAQNMGWTTWRIAKVLATLRNDPEDGLDYLENRQGVATLRNDPEYGLDYLENRQGVGYPQE
jgi:hypothetical protein